LTSEETSSQAILDVKSPKCRPPTPQQPVNPLPQAQAPSLHSFSATAFSGPTPPPEILKQYDSLVPGIAERFLRMPIEEAEHRRKVEEKVVTEKIRASKTGQIMAFILALLIVLGSFVAICLGFSLAGFGSLLVGASSFASLFVFSRKQQN
jgi:uncharacterized membrane protein